MVSDVAIKNVEWSGRCLPHVHGRRYHSAAARTAGHRITTLEFRRHRVSATQLEPEQTCHEICAVKYGNLPYALPPEQPTVADQQQRNNPEHQAREDFYILRSNPHG